MLAETSTPMTRVKCPASARDRRPAPQPKSSASSAARGKPFSASAASCASTSTCPVAKNSSCCQRPLRLSACDNTAHNGSSRPSVCQTRRRRSSSNSLMNGNRESEVGIPGQQKLPGYCHTQRSGALGFSHPRFHSRLRAQVSTSSTPSSPWLSVCASPPWASLILRRTSLAESAWRSASS